MKTLEELRLQAENMFCSKMQDPCSPLADLASRLLFRAGWSAAAEELLRWRNPKEELPEDNKQVLVKTDRGVLTAFHWGNGEFIMPQGGMGYTDLQPEEIDEETEEVLYDILGWRPIIELPEDGENTE